MRRMIIQTSILCSCVMFTLFLSYCGGSKSSKFYTLHPVSAATAQNPPSSNSRSSIGIVSVEVPDYVDRPQIVTRNANNGIEVAEFDRWAGDLRNDLARVLAETMSVQLPADDVFVLTGRRAIPADYRVTVNVTRFDAMANEVWLKALWTILNKDGRQVGIRGESSLREPIQGTGYGAIVAAMSRAVGRLGTEISDTIKPVLAKAASSRQAYKTGE